MQSAMYACTALLPRSTTCKFSLLFPYILDDTSWEKLLKHQVTLGQLLKDNLDGV